MEKKFGKINENWKEFIKPDNCKVGKIYGMMNTLKVDNPVGAITSGCNTGFENLSIYSISSSW